MLLRAHKPFTSMMPMGTVAMRFLFEVTVNPLPSLVSFTGEGTYCEGDDVNNLIVEVSGAPDYTLDYTSMAIQQLFLL